TSSSHWYAIDYVQGIRSSRDGGSTSYPYLDAFTHLTAGRFYKYPSHPSLKRFGKVGHWDVSNVLSFYRSDISRKVTFGYTTVAHYQYLAQNFGVGAKGYVNGTLITYCDRLA